MENNKRRIDLNIVIGLFLIIFAIMTFIPFYYVIVASISNPDLVREGELLLFPRGFSLAAYRRILMNARFVKCFEITVLRTVLGTSINLILQCSFAYALSRKYLPGKRFFMLYIIITMMFNGGIIPTYLIVKGTGLIDTIWALIIPGAVSTWNVILLKSFFESLPDSLEESAKIDGANDIFILVKIALPLSLPAISTIGLFAAVYHWNAFMDAVIYITKNNLHVLQIFLRDMVVAMQSSYLMGDPLSMKDVSSLSLRTSSIFIASIPIIMVYPFIQKHFIKGIMIGAVKG